MPYGDDPHPEAALVAARVEITSLLAEHEAELAFEEKAHGQTLAERDAARDERDALRARVAELEDIPEYVNTQNDIEIAALRAKVEWQREAITNMVDKNMQLNAEVERLKVARDGFYDDTVELRKQLIALRAENAKLKELKDLLGRGSANTQERLCGTIATLRAEVEFARMANEELLNFRINATLELASLRAEVERLKEFEVWSEDQRAKLRAEVAKAQQYELDQRAEVERLHSNDWYKWHKDRIAALEAVLEQIIKGATAYRHDWCRDLARAALEKKP